MTSLASAETLTEDWVDVQEMAMRPKQTNKEDCLKFYQRLNDTVVERLGQNSSQVFVADLDLRGLYPCFLEALPEGLRQRYNCNTCRHFMRRYGGLAFIDDNGSLQPLLWHPKDLEIDGCFQPAVAAVSRLFKGRKVFREFKATASATDKMAATASKGGFHHLHLHWPGTRIAKTEMPGFAATPTTELAKMLRRILGSYQIDTVRRATQMLEQDKLPYADNHKAAAQWLQDLLECDKIDGQSKGDEIARHNLLYRYAASSFTGCLSQLRNGALSTLLEDVEAQKPWHSILEQWKQKTNPIQYFRPQAAPKAGNISASERLFNELGITKDDLHRRFLIFEDFPSACIMWRTQHSSPKKPAGLKLFANITPKSNPSRSSSPTDFPPTCITFTKFLTTVLITAKRLEYKLSTHNGLYFFITGHPNSKPLMHWHSDSDNNRASWYIYERPRHVKKHNLKPNGWNDVKAIVPFPHLWDGAPHTTTFPLPDEKSEGAEKFKWYHNKQGFRYLLSLEDIVDKEERCLCLFPTLLKGEFHGARATIESYSNNGKKEHVDGAEGKGGYVGGVAVGRSMGKSAKDGEERKHLMRVTDEKGVRSVWEVVLFE